MIFRHYVAQAAEQAGITAPEISSEHLASLMASDWPGNARSLMSAAMRFVLGMPEEVAQAALFLASPLASGITGVALNVDAGLMAGNLPFLNAIS